MKGWSVTTYASGVHAYPNDDIIAHEMNDEGVDCACIPHVEPVPRSDGTIGWLYMHHAWDNRE